MADAPRKLIIQIPAFNEAEQLPAMMADLPREVAGFDVVEWLVIDDGSADDTSAVARAQGADHVVRHQINRGLAATFMTGLEASLRRGADVIVNTDADNQYDAGSIPDLTAPILAGQAQLVVGARPIAAHQSFSPLKKALQQLGSWVVRRASGTSVPDAPSGFRAIGRDLAMKLYVFNGHTYTLETLIQAGRLNVPVASVPVKVNPDTRPSRLMRSMAGYIGRSALTIARIFILYNPLRFFGTLALILTLPGIFAFGRFLIFWLQGDGGGNLQSLIIGAAMIAAGVVTLIGGLLADLIAANRILLAELRTRHLAQELEDADARSR